MGGWSYFFCLNVSTVLEKIDLHFTGHFLSYISWVLSFNFLIKKKMFLASYLMCVHKLKFVSKLNHLTVENKHFNLKKWSFESFIPLKNKHSSLLSYFMTKLPLWLLHLSFISIEYCTRRSVKDFLHLIQSIFSKLNSFRIPSIFYEDFFLLKMTSQRIILVNWT